MQFFYNIIINKFTASCFRRDEIDATHYPVFHQVIILYKFRFIIIILS